jgi:Leucine-rich repeat (LRR) protein
VEVGKLVSLTTLHILSNYGAVSTLNLTHNEELVQLNLSQTRVNSLYFGSNKVTFLNLVHKQLQHFELPHNSTLRSLYLRYNRLEHFSVANNSTLTRLSLYKNRITSFDIEDNDSLIWLSLNNNKLSSLNLKNNCSLTSLGISNNPDLKEVTYLPPSLEYLLTDRQAILDFDFGTLPRLRWLYIYNGKTKKSELKNLSDKARLFSGDHSH